MRDWRGIKAVIGDRVLMSWPTGPISQKIHVGVVEEADESQIPRAVDRQRVRQASGNGREIHRLKQPEDFVVVKGQVSS